MKRPRISGKVTPTTDGHLTNSPASEQTERGRPMALPLCSSATIALRSSIRAQRSTYPIVFRVHSRRSFFSWFQKPQKKAFKEVKQPILTEDNLFHLFSKSPFPAVKARGEAIKSLAPCPVCASSHDHLHAHTKAQPKAVKFECPDCGFPTHCSEEHWREDEGHKKYCSRLKEVNEDEHDLRSGRRLREFELPGESMISFSSMVDS